MPPSRPWIALPDAARLRRYLGLSLLLDALFVVVYGGSNWLATRRDRHLDFSLPWESEVPFVPGLILAYLSVFALFLLPLFAGPAARLWPLARRMALAIGLAGAVFLLFPGKLAFPRPEAVPGYEALFGLLYALDPPHNLFPSLHVALSAVIVWTLTPGAPTWFRTLLGTWLALIGAAVVLVHQHQVLDVAGGLALAALCVRLVRTPSSG